MKTAEKVNAEKKTAEKMTKDIKDKERKNIDNYIQIIAELKSISATAETLGISQPALSASLKKKEKELGGIIFDRTKQPLELTEVGKAYLDYVGKQEQLKTELEQRISDISGLKSGHLTIGGATAFNIAYLPKAVGQFKSLYPNIEIRILDRSVPELVNEALKGGLDVFLTPRADDKDRFNYEILLEERLMLCVPKAIAKEVGLETSSKVKSSGAKTNGAKPSTASSSPAKSSTAKLSAKDFSALCEYPFVVLRNEQDIGIKMRELCRRYNCEPKSVIMAEQTMTSLALSMSGVGISLVSEGSIKSLGIGDDVVSFYHLDEKICNRKLYTAWPKFKYLSKTTEEFIRVLKETNND